MAATSNSINPQHNAAIIAFWAQTEPPALAPPPTPEPYADVPALLKALPNWVGWKSITRDGKPTKVPFNVKTGYPAKADSPSTWTTFEQVVKATDVLNGSDYSGIGFELGGTNIVGIDFDNAINPEGVIDPYALAILKILNDPYTEISPSGTGLHAFVACDALPEGGRKLSLDHTGIEIYHGREGGRYFTMTGERVLGEDVPQIADMTLPYLLITQNKDKAFKSLWLGDISAFGGDDSDADYALMCRLAALTQSDPAKMEKFFGASVLGQREKWTGRKDYRQRTIKSAINGEPTKSTKGKSESQGAAHLISRTGSDIKPKHLKWLWEKRIPLGKLTLFAGNPDNGKSLAANSVAAICTTGRNFPDSQNTLPPSDVLMLLGEDDLEDTAVPRLMAAGADMSRIQFVEGAMRGNGPDDPKLDVDMPALDAKIQEFPNARLLIIDPISNYLGKTNMFGEQDVRSEILVPLKRLAEKYNIAIVIVMHLNKKAELDAINRVGGAMAFIGVARCSWMFVRDIPTEEGETKDSFSMSRIKNNLIAASHGGLTYKVEAKVVFRNEDGDAWAPFVVWGTVVQKSADEALGTTRRREAHRPKGTDSKVQVAVKFLEKALADGPKHRKELENDAHEAAGITPKTLRNAQEKLGIKPEGKGKDWTWALPKPTATTEAEIEEAGDNPPLITREFRLQ